MALQDYNFYSVDPTTRIEDYLNKSYVGQMIRYQPNGQAPIFALTDMSGSNQATSVEHGYFAKTIVFPNVVTTAAAVAGDTTLSVESTETVLPGDLLRSHATGEVMRVMTVPNDTTIVVHRAIGTIAAGVINLGESLFSIGNAHEQASLRPPSRLINPVRVINNTQIFRNTWMVPRTLGAIQALVGDSVPAESRADCGMFHAQDIEKALIFGQKSGRVLKGQWCTTMDGIVETVRRLAPAENTSIANATTDYMELEAMLEPVFDTVANGRSSNERVLIVGGQARTVINNIGRLSGQYQIVDGQTNFGLQFQTFKTTRGTFRMIEHPLLNANADWKKMALALDLPSIKLAYLRRTKNEEFNENGTPVDYGVDAVGGTLTTELTAEITSPSSHAVIFGLTQGVAES